MRGAQLFDLFVAQGVTTAEIAAMDADTVTRHVAEMRQADPDEIPMTDREIAAAILEYAQGEVTS